MADDIGFECYGAYGSSFYSTPNIDRLAETGALFTQAFTAHRTPSRVKIMTGRYNFGTIRNSVSSILRSRTSPRWLKLTTIDYDHGKWQLSPENLDGPFQAGFDDYLLGTLLSAMKELRYPIFKDKGSDKSPRLFKNGKVVRNWTEPTVPMSLPTTSSTTSSKSSRSHF